MIQNALSGYTGSSHRRYIYIVRNSGMETHLKASSACYSLYWTLYLKGKRYAYGLLLKSVYNNHGSR